MHVAITGASTGIGAAIAREFASHGAQLTLVARRESLLQELAKELSNVRVLGIAQDLGQSETATSWIAGAESELGPIDVLVNNAGVQIVGPSSVVDVEAGEALLRLNVNTPLRLIRHLLPAMVARKSGCFVNISSMAALAPTPGMLYYNTSKAGFAAGSEALRGELRGTGVNVVTVYPGIIETDMGKAGLASYEQSRMLGMQPRGKVEVLAKLIWRAVERRRGRIIYPYFNNMARWFPGITRFMMDRFTPPLSQKALSSEPPKP